MRKKIAFLFSIAFLGCLLALPVSAVVDVHEFDNDNQEQRYKTLIAELRCPMCLNANLAASDAAIAQDLRAEIYDQIMEGRSDEEIMVFLTDRYGDFINYRPPLNRGTLLLWFGPGILLLAGFFIAIRMMRSSQKGVSDSELSAAENKKLQDILSSHSED